MAGYVAKVVVAKAPQQGIPEKAYYPGDIEMGDTKSQPMTPNTTPMQQEECFNVQWLLFIIGFVVWPVSLVACFLPLCNGRGGRSRFPTKCYKSGWIGNIVLSIWGIAWMTAAIAVSV